MTEWEEVDDFSHPEETRSTCSGPENHRWMLSIEQGEVSLRLHPDESCEECMIDAEYLELREIPVRLVYTEEHPGCDGWNGIEHCDCSSWWVVIPEVPAEDAR